MCNYLLVENSIVIAQYLLDCPSNQIRNVTSKVLVALVHLSVIDPPLEIKLGELSALQNPSISVLVSYGSTNSNSSPRLTTINSLLQILAQQQQQQATNLEKKIYFVYQSDSLIQTLISILNKRNLITEQSSKYLLHFFQFFNFYSSLGLQQSLHLI
jgi:hypothetical protein